MGDTASVEFELTNVERIRRGPIIAMADAVIALDGVELLVCGFTLRRDRAGGIEFLAPEHRHPTTGKWCPSFTLPTELLEAIGRAVVAETVCVIGSAPAAA